MKCLNTYDLTQIAMRGHCQARMEEIVNQKKLNSAFSFCSTMNPLHLVSTN